MHAANVSMCIRMLREWACKIEVSEKDSFHKIGNQGPLSSSVARFGKITPVTRRALTLVSIVLLGLAACSPGQSSNSAYPTYNPFLPFPGTARSPGPDETLQPTFTRTPGPTPTRAPLSVTLALHAPDATLTTPTPDMIRTLPTLRQSSYQYTVQTGDTLGSIAQTYGVSVETLLQANHLADANALAVGQNLIIPAPAPALLVPSFKVIPDSELVYGPASAQFDVAQFIQNQGGYLASYTQVINNQTLSGADGLVRVAQDYSVNPRLLLALIEYRSKWVTRSNPDPVTYDYPLGFVEPNHSGLYHQLTWAANELNRGFYLWRA